MKVTHWILFAALAGAGCAHAPRPYVFTSDARPADQVVSTLAQALTRQGHQVAEMDARHGQLVTLWEDTHYRFRETDDLEDETSVFVRYHVQLDPVDRHVSVVAEAQRCVPYRAIVTPNGMQSTCVKMDRIFTTQQRAVDQLGQALAASLAGTT